MTDSNERRRRSWRVRDRRGELLRWAGWLGFAIAFMAAAVPIAERTEWAFFFDAPRQGGDLLVRMWPPDTSILGSLLVPLRDTLNIATLGTIGAVLIAFPLSWLAARNTRPHPVLRLGALLAIAASRSVSSFIWALVFILITGPGVFAGVLAIAARSIGFVAKLGYEAIEEIDEEPVDAVTATGAGALQVGAFAILPQVMPTFLGVAVFRWDINIRESTVIGYVGGGGLGMLLESAISDLAWRQASLILLLIVGIVLAAEALSARLRKGAAAW